MEGSFWPGTSGQDATAAQVALVVSIAFMLMVGLSATAGPRRVSLSFLYRWMCPALVVGFAAFIVLGEGAGAYVAYVVAIAARFAFCLITQMYFARYAVQGAATPVQSYGLGWIFVHLGDLLGVVALVLIESGVAAGAFSLDQVVAVSIALLVSATMFVLSDGRAFAFGARKDVAVAALGGKSVASSTLPGDSVVDAASEVDELTVRILELAQCGGLTRVEAEVFDLLARTLQRASPTCDALVISRETAATHAKHVYRQLDVHSAKSSSIWCTKPPYRRVCSILHTLAHVESCTYTDVQYSAHID